MVMQRPTVVYRQCEERDENGNGENESFFSRARGLFRPRLGTSTISIPLPPPEDTTSTISGSSGDSNIKRDTWSHQFEFFLSCVGYAVGLGNVWRFPYLCYQNGGGAFLVPYLIFLSICGVPLFFLEMSFGQFASLGPIAIWRISPLFKGLGYGMLLISVIVCIYYNVIIAWTLYYIFESYKVSWATCGNVWNTDNCIDQFIHTKNVTNVTEFQNNTFVNSSFTNQSKMTSSEEFWLNHVLRLTDGIDNLGEMQFPLVIALLLAWVLVFLCLQRGVKTSGKVVYVTATLPYVVLLIFLVRGLTLPGAIDGIYFYLQPQWHLLKSFKVWGDAATQIFYSVGAAWGAILTMASYNKFTNNAYRDSILIPMINCGTSILAGFVVFSIIGFMAYETGKPIHEVVKEGPGLAFVVYPEAIARLPFSPIWAFLFFFMLFAIGLDSQFGMFETALGALADEFPNVFQKRKLLCTALLCLLLFVLGLPCVTQGGMYVVHLMDWYSAAFSLMIISLFETIVICWVYGVDRFMQDISLMIGYKPGKWWKLCWCYITPGTIILLLIFIFFNHEAVKYNDYVYPSWSVALGWIMSMCSLIPIPIFAIIQVLKAKGTLKERLISCLRPTPEWGPAMEDHRVVYKKSLVLVTSRLGQLNVTGVDNSSLRETNASSQDSSTTPLQVESVV